jgi:hypothetical protein
MANQEMPTTPITPSNPKPTATMSVFFFLQTVWGFSSLANCLLVSAAAA